MTTRRHLLIAFAAVGAAAGLPFTAQPQRNSAIRIGEINSYSTIPQFTLPYRMGWQLAVEEVNAAGGLLGRLVEVVSRDDAGKPEDAIRLATELVSSEKVALLTGTFLSNVGLAVADFALRNRVVFVAAEPLTDALVWEKGNRYTFRLRPSTYMQSAMLVEEAAKLPAKRWAVIAPNYEYGQSAVANFKQLLKAKRPDVEFVAEQWPALGKLEASSTVQAIIAARPDAIFNVTFGADLPRLVREGNLRGLFPRVPVVSLLSGEPEYLDVLKDETPKGWIVTGYPWSQISTPEHAKFFNTYYKRYNDYPRLGSVVGYSTFTAIFEAIRKAKSLDAEKLIGALRGLQWSTPFGPAQFRAVDHQSTMGAYVGKLDVRDGKGVMVDWRYADGAQYLPSPAEATKQRPHEAQK
ncbi:MAG: ABC transporter substrate-binding protein [Burkholderiaceae bacterium]|nr:ABC transporter substrate-binding protein [Burkholderiaceae bacterium]